MKILLSILTLLSLFLPMVSLSDMLFEKNKLTSQTNNSIIHNADITYLQKEQYVKIITPLLKEIDNQVWLATSPKVERLTESGEKWWLSGDHMEIDSIKNLKTFIGHVIGKSNVKQLSSISCEKLIVDDTRKTYYTRGKTFLTSMNQFVTTADIEYNAIKNQIRIPNYARLVYDSSIGD